MIISLKKMLILAIITLLIGTTATWGLGMMNYPEIPVSKQAEKTVWPVKLTIILNKTSFVSGEEVNVTLKLTNIGNETVTLTFRSPMKVDFGICNESLQVIYTYSSTHGVVGILTGVTLDPGESLSRTLTWDQQAELGTYFVFGKTGPGSIVVKPYEQQINKIETDKIKIEVHP